MHKYVVSTMKNSKHNPTRRHRCVWCKIRSDQMKIPREERGRCEPRSLASMEADWLRFQSQGKGDVRKAKIVVSRVFQ